ncbi:MAG: endo alpha-1,4 polygalactosaminidase [Monoraphidium minutum]|nr:MAG: endo alpha-1,4 polygalactosaminidase [Monoraphidium minutum]
MRSLVAQAWAVVAGVLLALPAPAAPANASAARAAGGGWWRPEPGLKFEYLLSETFDPAKHLIPGVQVYLIDGFDTPASAVAALAAAGGVPVCYFSAGSREDWRPDAADFDEADLGAPLVGWEGERWLDVRSPRIKPIMLKRMEMCRDKGFLAVDPDNVDAFIQPGGAGLSPPLSGADQLAYNRWLADTAHGLGLGAGLKNDLGHVEAMAEDIDFFVNEQCMQYTECDRYAPARVAGKPVYGVEYEARAFEAACKAGNESGVTHILKTLDLDSSLRRECGPNGTDPRSGAAAARPPARAARAALALAAGWLAAAAAA